MAPYVQVYWTKKKRTCFNGLTFCITRHSGTGKLHPSQEALFIFSTLFAYALDHIGTVRHGLLFSNWPRMGRFHLRGLVKPHIWTSVITCKLDIVFQCATHNNSVVETSPTRDWDHLEPSTWWVISGTTPSEDWRIGLQLWDQWRASRRTVTETPGRHNARLSPQTMCNHLRRLHCVPDDRNEVPSWIGSGVLQGSTRLWYNAVPCSICLTQDFPTSNAVHTMPWPTYSPSGTSSSIGEGLHW